MSIAAPISDPAAASQLLRDYHEVDKDFRVQQAKIGCILVLICMPAGLPLDWFVYPDKLWSFFLFGRLLCDVAVLPLFLLLLSARAREYVNPIALAWPLLPGVAISWMIYMSQGSISPYYAGLNLVLIVACLLMPYTFREALVVCGATLALYLAACLGHRAQTSTSIDVGTLYNNVYFISITALICVCSRHFNTKRRIQEFALRRELDQRNKQLAEMDRLKSEFFSNVSHELRTPLTLILSPTDKLLAESDALPEGASDTLRTVRDNALRLLKLITDLLEVVRLDQKAGAVRPETFDVAQFARATVDSMRHLAEQKSLDLRYVGNADPVMLHADPSRLEKVLLNIFTNAIKFTPEGGHIAVNAKIEGGYAIIDCADTGIGIPAKDLPHIFDRFRQADGSATRKYQGVGIGLALARELVQEQKGTLTATSVVGRGTTLTIRIPVGETKPAAASLETVPSDAITEFYREADRAIVPAAPPMDWDELSHEHGAGKFSLLVIEDEPDLRRFIISLLTPNYRVRQASDGKTGLQSVEAHRPDLVLVDLMLPEMDGLEVCRRIKSNSELRHTRVVLLTARTDEESKLTALRNGADDFLQKPFSTAELTTRVANLLLSGDLERQVRDQNAELTDTLTKLKAAEAQLVQSEKMNAVGRLSAGILHEINNPLNAALMAVHVAKMKNENVRVNDCLVDLEAAMKRIQAITMDLRAFAHPTEAAGGELFTIESAVTSAEQLLAHELADLRLERRSVNGTQVRASRNQIIHVLINLISNSLFAVRATATERPPRIIVDTSVENGRLRITIEDNGSGIAAEDIGRVTEPFFTRRDVGEGMGLGLSICHTIIRHHGGTLKFESAYGAWTRVQFDLPLADSEIAS